MSRVWFEVLLCNKCVHMHERVCINASTAYQQIHTNKSQEFRIIPCYVILSTLYPPHPNPFPFGVGESRSPFGEGGFLFCFLSFKFVCFGPKGDWKPKNIRRNCVQVQPVARGVVATRHWKLNSIQSDNFLYLFTMFRTIFFYYYCIVRLTFKVLFIYLFFKSLVLGIFRRT